MAVRPILAAAVALLVSVPALGQAPTPLLPSEPAAPSAPPPFQGEPPQAGPPQTEPPQTIPAPQPLGPAAAPPPSPAEPAAPGEPVAPSVPAPGEPPPGEPPPAAEPPNAAPPAATEGPPEGRVFCNQSVNFTLAPRDSVPARFREFVGIFSDAAWTPQLCAALIVENVSTNGIATIVYVFGSMGTSSAGGGVLNGTGIIRGGELKFQNSDGSQYAFRPFYSDLDGHLVTPRGKVYETIFKRNF